MRKMTRVHLVAVLAAVAVAISLLGLPLAGAQEEAPAAGAYGPQLFLLRAGEGQADALAGLPLTVHGFVYGGENAESSGATVASGPADLSALAAEAGVPAEVLDADTTGKAYYFIDAQAEGASGLAQQYGSVLYADERQLLLGVPVEQEGAMLEALPPAGVSLALLPPEGLPLLPEVEPSAEATPGPDAVGATPLEAPNPAVQALLNQVTTDEIRTRIAQLSGVDPISTGSATVKLATRYNFASNVRTVEAAVFHQYQLLGYTPSYVNWTYGSYSGRNIVADLRGTVNPNRIWLVGGHFDSTSDVPYSNAPGADDNASGTASTLVLARVLAGQRFADTIRFVQFGGEEQGMWGSISYTRGLINSGATVVGFINLDMIGWDSNGDRTVEVHSGTRSNSISFAQRVLDANSRYIQGLRLELKQSSASRFSDHSSFWDRGYASFLTIENFYDDAIARDRNPYYHKTGDTLSRVNLDYVARTARTALAMLADGAGLIDGSATPTPTATPAATRTPTPTATPTATPPPSSCTERITNGGFESTGNWTFTVTGNTGSYTTAKAHTGARSARLGIVPAGVAAAAVNDAITEESAPAADLLTLAPGAGNPIGDAVPNAASYSTTYQTVSLPAKNASYKLTYWYWTGTEATSGNTDFQRVLLLKPGTYSLLKTLTKSLSNTGGWRQAEFDLAAYAGQSVVVYFEVYNDNTSGSPRSWMWIDDVSVMTCTGVARAGGGGSDFGAYLPMIIGE